MGGQRAQRRGGLIAPLGVPGRELVGVGRALLGGNLHDRIGPTAVVRKPFRHELRQHRDRRAAVLLALGVEGFVDQRVGQPVDHQVLGDEELEPVLDHQRVFHQLAHPLPVVGIHPLVLGRIQRVAGAAGHVHADLADDLCNPELIAGGEDRRRGHRRAVTAIADLGGVHVRAPGDVAQRQEVILDLGLPFGRQAVEHAALFDEVEIVLRCGPHPGTVDVVGRVVELARVAQVVPIRHHDLGPARIVELAVGLPERLVVEMRGRLDVQHSLFIPARRPVLAEAARDMAKRLPAGLEVQRLEVDRHGILPGRPMGVLLAGCGQAVGVCRSPAVRSLMS